MTKLQAFLETVDVSQAGTDEYGNLRWHIECSALANANASFTDATFSEEAWDEMAYDTAFMIYDCWEDFYPQLVKPKAAKPAKPATIKQIVQTIKDMGLSCRYISETKEFRINLTQQSGGTEDTAAYADRDDAIGTAQAIARHAEKSKAQPTISAPAMPCHVNHVSNVITLEIECSLIPVTGCPLMRTDAVKGVVTQAYPHGIEVSWNNGRSDFYSVKYAAIA